MDALTSLTDLARSFAACAEADAIREPDSRRRQYRWQAAWAPGVALGRYDSGAGELLRVVVGRDFGVLVGFDHESCFSPWARPDRAVLPGMFEGMPAASLACLRRVWAEDGGVPGEPPRVTFCYWRAPGDPYWRCGPVEPPRVKRPDDDGGAYWLAGSLPLRIRDYLAPHHPVSDELRDRIEQVFARAGLPPWNLERVAIPIRAVPPRWRERALRWLPGR